MSDKIIIHTDGSCEPNPGVGGWAALLQFGDNRKLIHGYVNEKTTNNRMEIQAAIEAFKALKPGKWDIVVRSDSQYLVNTMSGEWQAKTNTDLFIMLRDLAQIHSVVWEWVRGHSGVLENEIVNSEANAEAMAAYRRLSHD